MPLKDARPQRIAPPKAGRRLWFEIHSWIGVKLCLLMGFVCLTGTLAVYSQEIDWMLSPTMRAFPQKSTETPAPT